MSTTLSIRLPDELAHWVEEQARATGRSKISLIKEAIERARQAKTKPFMTLAGAVEGPPDLSERKGFARKKSASARRPKRFLEE
jgi:Arc/MetJ-type ribon-helix-helix transcriptional regulator